MNFRFPDKPQTSPPSFLNYINKREWVSQSKYDGWRMQIYKTSDELVLPSGEKLAPGFNFLSRVGRPLQSRVEIPKFLIEELRSMPIADGTVLDAEFVGIRGINKYAVYIFDCLALNNFWLTKHSFLERWNFCQTLKTSPNVMLADTREINFEQHFTELKFNWVSSGMQIDLCEGIVIKKKNGMLTLDMKDCALSKSSYKIKFREIRQERY